MRPAGRCLARTTLCRRSLFAWQDVQQSSCICLTESQRSSVTQQSYQALRRASRAGGEYEGLGIETAWGSHQKPRIAWWPSQQRLEVMPLAGRARHCMQVLTLAGWLPGGFLVSIDQCGDHAGQGDLAGVTLVRARRSLSPSG